ncbi:hypothetical protein AC579_8406 [Pseudocercospora musae]|uniref:glutathione-specific gamma-glutamylcyclotransferase n=1 Tax=Pseudocercospora musae TaxID=113226 RepID=A0A139IHX7_9PEZI|nr:hypothetical protein AC579_8406 [Pseudocercospora musae]
MVETDKDGNLWLFGYGLGADLRLPGYIEGYVRRFWQASEDHRGTPEAPGPPPRVWGAAYRVPKDKVAEVTEYMNIREINGYSIQYAPFKRPEDMSATYQDIHLSADVNSDGSTIRCLVYIGLPDNPQFLGPQDPQALAEHIVKSRGPSGENKDYLYELEAALNGLSPESEDGHIRDLARRCREIEARRQ